jgi:hypothetical protein
MGRIESSQSLTGPGTLSKLLLLFLLASGLSLTPAPHAAVEQQQAPESQQQTLSPDALERHRREVAATLELSAKIAPRAEPAAPAEPERAPSPPPEHNPREQVP